MITRLHPPVRGGNFLREWIPQGTLFGHLLDHIVQVLAAASGFPRFYHFFHSFGLHPTTAPLAKAR